MKKIISPPVRAKGLDGKEEPLGSVEEIAAHYVNKIIEGNPEGPYALAGYSFGGVIAYEIIKQLSKMGKEVKTLALLDTYAELPYHYKKPLSKKWQQLNICFGR